VTPDGQTEVRGTIIDQRERPPQVLVAHKHSSNAQSSCGDTDNNGIGGLVSFSATFEDVRVKDFALVSMISSEDIDEPGTYDVSIVVNNVSFQAVAHVRKASILHFEQDRT
jgi:hypothetical protein